MVNIPYTWHLTRSCLLYYSHLFFNRIILHQRNNTTVFLKAHRLFTWKDLQRFSHEDGCFAAGKRTLKCVCLNCYTGFTLKILPLSRQFFLFDEILHLLIARHEVHDSLSRILALEEDLVHFVRDWKVHTVFLRQCKSCLG